MNAALTATGLFILSFAATGQLQIVPPAAPQTVFGGGAHAIPVVFHNPLDRPLATQLRVQLYLASSATVIPLGKPREEKTLEVLPGQTVLESLSLTFPSVREATPVVGQWLDETNRVLGHSDIMVYPTNLLEALKPLAANKPVGVWDPQSLLKPLLAAQALETEDLETSGIRTFTGKLAIVFSPSASPAQLESLRNEILDVAGSGAIIVWIKPETKSEATLEPAIYPVPVGQGAFTVLPSRIVSGLEQNPSAQLNLTRAAQLAAKPALILSPNP